MTSRVVGTRFHAAQEYSESSGPGTVLKRREEMTLEIYILSFGRSRVGRGRES